MKLLLNHTMVTQYKNKNIIELTFFKKKLKHARRFLNVIKKYIIDGFKML